MKDINPCCFLPKLTLPTAPLVRTPSHAHIPIYLEITPSPQKFIHSRKTSGFICCVSDCNFKSDIHAEVLSHIINMHGAFKCISSGCHFVTKSRDIYTLHMQNSHPKLNVMVCPFLCKISFNDFSELLTHLSWHSKYAIEESPDIAEVEEDQEDAGFLKIESVGTLDPTSASQMFGEDYDPPPAMTSSPLQPSSPLKITVSLKNCGPNAQVPFINSASPILGISNVGSANTVPNMMTSPTRPAVFGNVVQGVFPLIGNVIQNSVDIFGGLPSAAQTATSQAAPTTIMPNIKEGGATVSSSVVESRNTLPQTTGLANLPEMKMKTESPEVVNPPVVDIRDDGDQFEGKSVKKLAPPPGIATMPKHPPTVPIQEVFIEFQPVDIFKILTTKLAPEVFKCMFRGCVYADDEPDNFLAHIQNHGSDYRCCYCLMLMASAPDLVEHVLTEHSNSQFQCKYCLYRAFTKIYMGVHLKNFHPYDEPRYIKVGTIRQGYPPSPPIDQFVRPYRCNYQECPYRTVDSEAFRLHVQQTHGPFVILSCDFCHKHLHVIPFIDTTILKC
ncbi:hypothetical protein SK128_011963 [Halocaridina rubra]|uniref:C2H2-type domain-containing protein n=1 Tax=Halocaridina rubra TaxID=373956 RepID=A0AAN8ZWJ3_HALRR